MTKFTKVDLDITAYKPKMKPIYVSSLKDLRAIPVAFGKKATVQVKADGEFNYLHMDNKQIFAVNRFGRKTEDLPALKELHRIFQETIKEVYLDPEHSADILAEMYGVDENGKPVTLPTFIHYLKGGDEKLHERIHLGIFDMLFIDDMNVHAFPYDYTFNMIKTLFNGKLCHVLDYVIPKNWDEIERFYTDKVQKEGWEGLVIRVNGETYKAKPNCDVDAVIIGINKNTKGYEKGLAKSIRVALMRDDGNFVELGDATVPSVEEARELFALTRVAVKETAQTLFVRPIVVVQISYISLFPDTINSVRDKETLTEFGTTMLVRMKSPRVVGYRKDKKVCTQDIGINQVCE